MTAPQYLVLWLVPPAYLLGSIPFGLLVGLAQGVDPRRAGSGNIGATNVGRLLGGWSFASVFTLDLLKGLLPMLLAGAVLGRHSLDTLSYMLWLLVGLAAILGHMYPLCIGFKGGKGVATGAGVILGLFPYYTLPAVGAAAVWLGVFWAWRYVSLASICAAASFPIWYVVIAFGCRWALLGPQLPLLVFAVAVALLVIYRHRENIARLRAGTEHAFRRK